MPSKQSTTTKTAEENGGLTMEEVSRNRSDSAANIFFVWKNKQYI